MELNDYQEKAMSTRLEKTMPVVYPALGLNGEAGEIADKVKKIIRDKEGVITNEDASSIGMELGDVLWYIAALAEDLDIELDTIAQANLNKLASRKKRDVIEGDGDDR